VVVLIQKLFDNSNMVKKFSSFCEHFFRSICSVLPSFFKGFVFKSCLIRSKLPASVKWTILWEFRHLKNFCQEKTFPEMKIKISWLKAKQEMKNSKKADFGSTWSWKLIYINFSYFWPNIETSTTEKSKRMMVSQL